MSDVLRERSDRLGGLSARAFDLLVIGGGITGCAIARDAALRGLSVALIEKNDFANGTSSRSSRLIHGGVRYLEHGHVHLVFESSAERHRLLRLAPHLVRPLAFTWPVYAGARIPRWKLGAGLLLYDALALFRNVERHKRLSRSAVLAREPRLRTDGLVGGARYFDAATNDARLTLANAVGAAEAGAVVLNHASVTALLKAGGRIVGATVRDEIQQTLIDVGARAVVNATGPWIDEIRALDSLKTEEAASATRGSKGAHIAVPRARVGNNEALTLLSPTDQRVLFILPAEQHAIIGTTDTYSPASADHVRATRDDVRYLLDSANTFFPDAGLHEGDVVSAWAGIRPLLPAANETPGAVTREHAVLTSESGLVTISGGKLTTYRIMAHDVVAAVLGQLGNNTTEDHAAALALPGGDFRSLQELIAAIEDATGDIELSTHLARSYGTRWTAVWSAVQTSDGATRVASDLPYTLGEFRYCVRNEYAMTLADLMIRRTHLAFETRDHGADAAPRVAAAIATLFDWDSDAQRRAVDDYLRETENIFQIDAPA
jgi:glycerol-3-phosphate dehydrogenase